MSDERACANCKANGLDGCCLCAPSMWTEEDQRLCDDGHSTLQRELDEARARIAALEADLAEARRLAVTTALGRIQLRETKAPQEAGLCPACGGSGVVGYFDKETCDECREQEAEPCRASQTAAMRRDR